MKITIQGANRDDLTNELVVTYSTETDLDLQEDLEERLPMRMEQEEGMYGWTVDESRFTPLQQRLWDALGDEAVARAESRFDRE